MKAAPLTLRKVLSGCGDKMESRANQGRNRSSLLADEVREGFLEEAWPERASANSAVVPYQDPEGDNLLLNPSFTIW